MKPIEPDLDPIQSKVLASVNGGHGWACIHVFQDETAPYSFTYTVGFWPAHPELLIVNLPQKLARQLLGEVYARVQAGEQFQPDKLYPGVIRDLDVAIASVPVEAQAEHFYIADWYHRDYGEWPFTTVQLCWPDPYGKFPWEPGYAAEACPQPILGSES